MGNYHQLYYHVTWATYERQPLIDDELLQPLHAYLKGKTIAMGGIAFAVGGAPNTFIFVYQYHPILQYPNLSGS